MKRALLDSKREAKKVFSKATLDPWTITVFFSPVWGVSEVEHDLVRKTRVLIRIRFGSWNVRRLNRAL